MERPTHPGRGTARGAPGQRGFSYLGLLFVLAILAVGWGAMGVVWSTDAARVREDELLYVGEQFRLAICRYYERADVGEKRFPTSLDVLVTDDRSASTVRHLRRLYRDPITGKPDWGLLKTPDERIQGVFSTSLAEPLKVTNFDLAHRQFEGAKRHADWIFAYRPGPPTPGRLPCGAVSQSATGAPSATP